jgi:hypothetical protein
MAALRGDISFRYLKQFFLILYTSFAGSQTRKYYLKNNYLTLKSKVKVSRKSLWYATHRLMVMHPHTKYNWPIWKDKKSYSPDKLRILKYIKCFQSWAYFEGLCITFNFENFQNKIFLLFILRTIQSMHGRYHRIYGLHTYTEPSGVFAHLRVQWLISQLTKMLLN